MRDIIGTTYMCIYIHVYVCTYICIVCVHKYIYIWCRLRHSTPQICALQVRGKWSLERIMWICIYMCIYVYIYIDINCITVLRTSVHFKFVLNGAWSASCGYVYICVYIHIYINNLCITVPRGSVHFKFVVNGVWSTSCGYGVSGKFSE